MTHGGWLLKKNVTNKTKFPAYHQTTMSCLYVVYITYECYCCPCVRSCPKGYTYVR